MSDPPMQVPSSERDRFLARVRAALAPRYEVVRMVGWGGMAAVFLAREPRLGREVAIKVMAPQVMADHGMVERFSHEARTTAQLSSPYVVTVFDVGEADGLHYMVMRFVGGRTLARVMEWASGPLSLVLVKAWLAQVAEALAHAHLRGVVHRDVKPSNILLALDGTALVSDFGIAKLTRGDPDLTRTGQIVGTPAYMSPEQCMGDPVTPASDQYALGAVAYQLLTGGTPFRGSTLEVLNAQVRERPPPVRERRSDCPRDLAEAVERMLSKKPQGRWPDLNAFLDALELRVPRSSNPTWTEMAEVARPVATVEVEEPADPLHAGDEVTLTARVLDEEGRFLPGRRIVWESRNPDVVAVDVSSGRLRARAPGRGEVVARSEDARVSMAIQVEGRPTAESDMAHSSAAASVPTLVAPSAPPAPAMAMAGDAEGGEDAGKGMKAAGPGRGGDGRWQLVSAGLALTAVGAVAWAFLATGEGDGPPAGLAPGETVPAVAEGNPRSQPQGVPDETSQTPTPGDDPAAGPTPTELATEPEPSPEPTPAPEGPAEVEVAPEAAPAPISEADLQPEEADLPMGEPADVEPEPEGVEEAEMPPEVVDPGQVDPEAANPDVAQISGIVRRFAEAIANRDEVEMLAAHPGFGGEEEWWVYGQEEREEALGRTVNLIPRSELIPIGSTATVVFSMTVRLTDEEGQVLDEEVFPLTMRFQRDQESWVLRELW